MAPNQSRTPLRREDLPSALLVEDTPALQQLVGFILSKNTVTSRTVDTVQDAVIALLENVDPLLVLDNDLRDGEGGGQKILAAMADPAAMQELLQTHAPESAGTQINLPQCIIFNSASIREDLRRALLPLQAIGIQVHLVEKTKIAPFTHALLQGNETSGLELDLSVELPQ